MATLATNTNWDALDRDTVQRVIDDPRTAGAEFTAFLKNGGKLIIGEPKVIQIDRTSPFDPVVFIADDWTIEEEDERALGITELDFTQVRFETCLRDGERYIKGEEKLRRLKEDGRIRLDAKIFQTFWENKHLIPPAWKEKRKDDMTKDDMTLIFFDGTILRSPDGILYVLCLYWDDGQWGWSVRWLADNCYVSRPSAVLAS
jgi:hypothetical protein